jgi:hypothetical protein
MELKVELCCCSTILTSLLFHVCLFLVVPIVVPMTSLARARSLSGDYGWGGGVRGGRPCAQAVQR